MSDKLGPVNFGKKEEEIFLGREIAQHRDYSEQTAIMIDSEVNQIVNKAMERAKKILNDNVELLHKLSAALLEREILDSDEIDKIMKGEMLPPYEKPKIMNGTSKDEVNPENNGNGVDKKIDEVKGK